MFAGSTPARSSVAGRGLHHPFGAAHEGGRPRAVPAGLVEQLGDDADPAEPFGAGPVDDLGDLDVDPAGEGVHLVDEQPVARRPRAEVEADGAEPRSVGQDARRSAGGAGRGRSRRRR